MSTDQVINEFGWALVSPGVDKDGNVLAHELERRASMFLATHRASLIEVTRDWLERRDELLTVQAAVLVGRLRLGELTPQIIAVREDVVAGTFLRPSSVWVLDRVIARLDSPSA